MRTLSLALAAALGWIAAGSASAQTYPSQPIKLVVPFAPGGGSDILARVISDPLAKRLGQPVVIENKPGAGATLGALKTGKSEVEGAATFTDGLRCQEVIDAIHRSQEEGRWIVIGE